jgi:hypothetical protein
MVEGILMAAEAEHELLPETFEFLNLGWWILHLVGIPVVFLIGFLVGRRGSKATPAAPQQTA